MDLLGVGVMFGPIAGIQFGTRMTPAWFLICRTLRNLAQSLNNSSGNSGNCGGDHRAWRRVHETHESVPETGQGGYLANAAHAWINAKSDHPTTLRYVA